jgi:hypothetical protein
LRFSYGFRERDKIATAISAILASEFPKDFVNLILTDQYYGRYNPGDVRAVENNIVNLRDSLNFNSVHFYGYGNTGGSFDSSISTYSGYVSRLMDTIRNSGLRGYYGRNKIEYLCRGQRLEYESEGGNNGFSYQRKTGSIITDSGYTVVHACPPGNPNCNEGDATPRYLCDSIYENLQHGDLPDFSQAESGNWFIKPRMRIDSNAVDTNPEDSVVRIDVFNYAGDLIKSTKIKAKNFARNVSDSLLQYSGRYLEEFDFSAEPPGTNLSVSGSYDSAENGLNKGMKLNEWYKWKKDCRVDFKVWWYGKVEVWFDKMVVDDEWGNNLFNSDTAIRLPMERRISEEVSEFTDNIGDGYFYIDEHVHSNIPCIKRVYEVMKQTNPNAKLHFAGTNMFNVRGYKDNSIGHRELLKALQTESFQADAHELQMVCLPSNLSAQSSDSIETWRFVSNSAYNEHLQRPVFGDKSTSTGINTNEDDQTWDSTKPSHWGSLVYQISQARTQRDAYSPQTKFIMQPQLQGLLTLDSSTGYLVGGVREPLNEEIEAQAMVSIARGADGISWFQFVGLPSSFKSGVYQVYGLLDPKPPYPRRNKNHYGQDKWKAVCSMNAKLKRWKPVLDSLNWQSGYSVHAEGVGHEFINDIYSLYRDPQSPDEFPIQNDDTTKYWEMGFFNPDAANSRSKYFIMVNRRCVPDLNQTGDLRNLRIKFDSTQLTGFNNWSVTELDSNHTVATFDRRSASFIDFGLFQPGEGKLYKLAPVMQEGGTLVADEDCGGFEFECRGEVNNNGHDITIVPNTTIVFVNTSARINMNGGSFNSGSSTESIADIIVCRRAFR